MPFRPGIPLQPYFFLVSKVGNRIEAQNHKGRVQFSDTDAMTVIKKAYDATPEHETIYVKGDITINSTLKILKNINYIHDGVAALNSDYLEIGDATHFVRAAHIRLNQVDGQNKAPKAIILRNCTAMLVNFNKIKTCNVGIYLDPIGTGCGENVFIGGWVSNCNVGIDCNASAPAGKWAQGNLFIVSVYACSITGIRFRGPAATDMQIVIGTSDNAAGIDPEFPGQGGGNDITDIMYNNLFLMRFTRPAATTLGEGSKLLNYGGDRLSLLCVNRNPSVNIGLSNTYGSATSILDMSLPPRSVRITWGGTFDTGETVTVAFQAKCSGGITSGVEKSATSTGTYDLTEDEIFTLTTDAEGFLRLDIWAKTNKASTNVTVNVRVRR